MKSGFPEAAKHHYNPIYLFQYMRQTYTHKPSMLPEIRGEQYKMSKDQHAKQLRVSCEHNIPAL